MKCNECTAPAEACNYCEIKPDATPIEFEKASCSDGCCSIAFEEE